MNKKGSHSTIIRSRKKSVNPIRNDKVSLEIKAMKKKKQSIVESMNKGKPLQFTKTLNNQDGINFENIDDEATPKILNININEDN